MEFYMKANDDLLNFPVLEQFPSMRNANNHTRYQHPQTQQQFEQDAILHENPSIIVLREDLDYYCVPQLEFEFEPLPEGRPPLDQYMKDDLLQHCMSQLKVAAGSYLLNQTSIFQGLYLSNKIHQHEVSQVPLHGSGKSSTLGPAEQHLMDMLCSSGFLPESQWGNRTQEFGKTIISSLSLCRLYNESTEDFRNAVTREMKNWKKNKDSNDGTKRFSMPIMEDGNSGRNIDDNVRNSVMIADDININSMPDDVYKLVPKPTINNKLLLFWRKPARKSWWSAENVELEVEIYGSIVNVNGVNKVVLRVPQKNANANDNEFVTNTVKIPIKLHIRRVWTLELSVVGIQ